MAPGTLIVLFIFPLRKKARKRPGRLQAARLFRPGSGELPPRHPQRVDSPCGALHCRVPGWRSPQRLIRSDLPAFPVDKQGGGATSALPPAPVEARQQTLRIHRLSGPMPLLEQYYSVCSASFDVCSGQARRLSSFLLMAILPKPFFPFVGSDLVSLAFTSAWHNDDLLS